MEKSRQSQKRKFTWGAWNYDLCGEAYIIAKDQCPKKESVPDFICREDGIPHKCKSEMVVQEGWCRWEVRTDWEDGDGEPCGWYVVYEAKVKRAFPVWIVRKDEWY